MNLFYQELFELPGSGRLRLLSDPRCYGGSSSKTQSSTTSEQITQSGGNAPVYNASGGGTLAIDASPTITKQAFDAITTLIGQALGTQGQVAQTATQTTQNQAGDLSNLVSAVLAQDQATAANQASSGQTDTNKTVLWVVGIAAGVLALIMLFRK